MKVQRGMSTFLGGNALSICGMKVQFWMGFDGGIKFQVEVVDISDMWNSEDLFGEKQIILDDWSKDICYGVIEATAGLLCKLECIVKSFECWGVRHLDLIY